MMMDSVKNTAEFWRSVNRFLAQSDAVRKATITANAVGGVVLTSMMFHYRLIGFQATGLLVGIAGLIFFYNALTMASDPYFLRVVAD